ncbi:MAG: acetylglutamate kinase [Limnochordaceae bacterium]|uniref:acetylglutamate kinase n=1 Tax=Carboxydichorda subterranea TaxID=3109565 RepID=UPI001A0E4811|nr:acetylglutamate kinase [Limnochordaceae bacterium]
MEQTIQKASVLVESLPYIRTFFGKTFVIKYGGSAMPDQDVQRDIALDVILLRYVGVKPVLVHGGGPAITETMRAVGREPQFVNGRRVTDAETMRIVRMVMMGIINTDIVSTINRFGGKAVGLSGHDGNLIVARKRLERAPTGETVDLGFVGDVERIHPELVQELAENGYIPVVAPIGAGYQGESYNINADSVAGELAAALRADKLIILTDVEGILEEPGNPASLISALQVQRARRMMEEGSIAGGMVPKVEACIRALEAGVPRTHIIDGRVSHSLLLEIFTDRGIGTMVVS